MFRMGHGCSLAQFYQQRSKYGGHLTLMKELEYEYKRLKKLYAEEKLKADLREELLRKKW